jgi:uncharacterized membrane protein (DUF485 family)
MDPAAARRVLESPEFGRLIRRRWTVSLLLTACLFLLYYGFILLVGLNKEVLASRIGDATTLGIPLGMGVIVGAWLLTAAYVVWANRRWDAEARRLRDRLER